jgi:hypothetical protein
LREELLPQPRDQARKTFGSKAQCGSTFQFYLSRSPLTAFTVASTPSICLSPVEKSVSRGKGKELFLRIFEKSPSLGATLI